MNDQFMSALKECQYIKEVQSPLQEMFNNSEMLAEYDENGEWEEALIKVLGELQSRKKAAFQVLLDNAEGDTLEVLKRLG